MNPSKIIVITGASRGIGRQCAISLAKPDNHLILIARNELELHKVSAECQQLGSSTDILALDLLELPTLKLKIESIKKQFGHIDILINNAGVFIENNFENGDMDLWDDALDINLKSTIHLTRYCLDVMPEGSSIIFIASTASRKAYANGTNYCASKFGILGFATALFEDIREKGIKVCSILPGVVNTDMHKGELNLTLEKMIQPEDIAETIQFILSMPSHVCPTEITLLPQKNPKSYPKR